jgi:hypothetical protein
MAPTQGRPFGRSQVRYPALRRRVLLVGLPMAGGAGLVVHILAGISLPLAIGVLALGGAALWAWVVSRLPAASRTALRRRAGIGVVAGLAGTVAYDLARYGTVALFSMSFQPFHVLYLFGVAFIGAGHAEPVTYAVGLAYHVANGTFFGLAYTLVFRRPTWWTGALWGIALEVCMATLYPSWLRIQMLREFLEVSALGHVVYGSVLGLVAARGVARLAARPRVPEGVR